MSTMSKYKCYYGHANLQPSKINEYDRAESRDRLISHINHPTNADGNEQPGISNIWLHTHGLKSFMIECLSADLDNVIKQLNLIRP